MSSHEGRKKRWVQISSTRYNCAYGYIQKNKNAMWDGYVIYQIRPPLEPYIRGLPTIVAHRHWARHEECVGERKRAREAMMAVEERVKAIKTKADPDVLL